MFGIGCAIGCVVVVTMFAFIILRKLNAIKKSGIVAHTTIIENLAKIHESQRLSIIIDIQPSSLSVSQEDFEPNRSVLKAKIPSAMRDITSKKPDTMAYVMLDNLGLFSFLERGAVTKNIKVALTRLIANDNLEGAENFLNELVDNL